MKKLWLKYKEKLFEAIAVSLATFTLATWLYAKEIKHHGAEITEIRDQQKIIINNQQDYTIVLNRIDSLGKNAYKTADNIEVLQKDVNELKDALEITTKAIDNLNKSIREEHEENQGWFKELINIIDK